MIVQLTQYVAINPEFVRAVIVYKNDIVILWRDHSMAEMKTHVNAGIPEEQHLTVRDVVRLLNRNHVYMPSSPAFPQDTPQDAPFAGPVDTDDLVE